MGWVESGWHGVGSRDRAADPVILSKWSNITRDRGFPLYLVDLTLIRILLTISYEEKRSLIE